eukprot:4277629-Prymnesium_polylepis.1
MQRSRRRRWRRSGGGGSAVCTPWLGKTSRAGRRAALQPARERSARVGCGAVWWKRSPACFRASFRVGSG